MIFGLIPPRIERTIYHIRNEQANHYFTDFTFNFKFIYVNYLWIVAFYHRFLSELHDCREDGCMVVGTTQTNL
jgi:hypothetical protein